MMGGPTDSYTSSRVTFLLEHRSKERPLPSRHFRLREVQRKGIARPGRHEDGFPRQTADRRAREAGFEKSFTGRPRRRRGVASRVTEARTTSDSRKKRGSAEQKDLDDQQM